MRVAAVEAAVVACVAALGACTSTAPPGTDDESARSRATASSAGGSAATALVVATVTPGPVKPGDRVKVSADTGPLGVAYELQASDEGGWVTRFILLSSEAGYGTRPTWADPADNPGYPDLGVTGEVELIVPPGVKAGAYRLCAEPASREVCGMFEIADR